MMTRSEKGSVLIAVIVAIVIFSALGAGLASLVTSGVRSSVDHGLSIQAFYAAESGFEWARKKLLNSEDCEDWKICCDEALEVTRELKKGYFKVDSSSEVPEGCQINVLGWVGSESIENAIVSRSLTGVVPVEFIEGGTGEIPEEKNVFSEGEDSWNCQGAGQPDCEDGKIVFDAGGSVKLNRSGGNIDIVDEENYDESGDVYFFARITNWQLLQSFEIGSNHWGGECTNLQDCFHDEEYGVFLIHVGTDVPISTLNRANVSLDVEFLPGAEGSVVFEWGCIGSYDQCSFSWDSHSPVGDWEEG